MVSLQGATRIIRDFLRANITDPLNRPTGNWIYEDKPRASLAKNSFPRIGVLKVRSDKGASAIGTVKRYEIGSIDIIVKTKYGQKLTINTTQYKDYEIVAYLADQIEEAIKSNYDYFRSQGIIEVMPIYENSDEDDNKNPFVQVGLTIKYIK